MFMVNIFIFDSMPISEHSLYSTVSVYMQNEGVRVFIQVYKELELAIQLGSEYAQKILKHPNIVVSMSHTHTHTHTFAHTLTTIPLHTHLLSLSLSLSSSFTHSFPLPLPVSPSPGCLQNWRSAVGTPREDNHH